MKLRTAAAVLFTVCLLTGTVRAAAPVDIQRHWAGPVIQAAMVHGALSPGTDGRFRPDQPVTAEVAAEALAALPPLNGASRLARAGTLAGAMGAWTAAAPLEGVRALPAVGAALAAEAGADPKTKWVEQGVLTAELLGADTPLTRGELAGIISRWWRAEGIYAPTHTLQTAYADLEGAAHAEDIRFLLEQGIFLGRADGSFSPDEPVTRGELAALLCRLAGWEPVPPEVDLPEKNVIDVPYSSQVYPLRAWKGCEATCLYMAMRSKGLLEDMTLKAFIDGQPMDDCNPARGFVGSPYQTNRTLRTTIYPGVLALYGRGLGADAVDFSGSSPAELQAEILAGNPVVAYLTLDWEPPIYSDYEIDGQVQNLVRNNHAMLVCGYDSATGQYYIADPYNVKAENKNEAYKYWVDGVLFEEIYNVRRHAIVIR